MSMADDIVLYAVGDIAPDREDPGSIFQHVAGILNRGDIVFGQLEANLSDRGTPLPQARLPCRASPQTFRSIKDARFNIVSFASNHCMDLGPDVMLETVDVLRKLGFAVIGVGRNIEEARKPAIIERKGTKIAFLAYASVLRTGYNAGPDRAGCAPMRAWTLYHQLDYQPGTPPLILTFPYKDDLEALIEDVKKAKAQADLVALSFHWGIHFYHAAIATYQKEVAHAAIDAGADIILGHHPHILKGIEVYKGKAIFYSMGNFAFDLPMEEHADRMKRSPELVELVKLYGIKHDPEWKNYCLPPESRKSMIVRCNILDKKIQRACFLPVLINQRAQPQVVPREDKNFDELVQYMKEITESQELKTEYSIEGGEIVVSLN